METIQKNVKSGKYKKYLREILNSGEFSHAAKHGKLLKFLYNATIANQDIHETEIAFDFFKRDNSFNPSEDTIVRVYMHEIRKKLDIYYRTEGKNKKVRIKIPKGQYTLEFTEKESTFKKYLRMPSLFLILLIIISMGINFSLIRQKSSDTQPRISTTDPVWTDFIKDDKPVLIVIGNFFFFSQYNDELERNQIVRDFFINSESEYNNLIANAKSPENYSDDINFTYLGESSAWGLVSILPVFNTINKPVELRLVSELTAQDMMQYHIIFIGYFRTLGKLANIFNFTKLQYLDEDTKTIYLTSAGDTIKQFIPSGSAYQYHSDLGMIGKFPGPNNNAILLITGFRHTATSHIVDHITHPDLLRQLKAHMQKTLGSIPPYFELLYDVRGVERTALTDSLLICEPFNGNRDIW